MQVGDTTPFIAIGPTKRLNSKEKRQAERGASRRSLLMELAVPTVRGSKRLSARQTRAAVTLNACMEVKWGYPRVTASYGGESGRSSAYDPKIACYGQDRDIDAINQLESVKQALHDSHRQFLGAIEAINFAGGATLAKLPIVTSLTNAEDRALIALGNVQMMLNAVADAMGIPRDA